MSQLYQPLDLESYQIRLLSFVAGDQGLVTSCRLERHSLLNTPPYNALSYCWGDETVVTDIIVNGFRISVTSNLAAALKRVCELDSGQRLWVDALCINQADSQEKSLQVQHMKHIYDRAQITYAWLGGSAIHHSSFLWRSQQPLPHRLSTKIYANVKNSVSKRLDAAQDDQLTANFESLPTCQALFEILQDEYWRRRWIIQELVAAKQVQIVDQHAIIALEALASALWRSSNSPHWSTQYEVTSKYFREILEFRQDYLEEKSLTLCTAILRTKKYLSRDIRDRAYALTGICSDGPTLIPLPNYHQTREEVARDLTRKFISRNANMDLMFFATAVRFRSGSLPSWTPDWLSSNLDSGAQIIADAAREYPAMLANYALRAEPNVLKVQGITLGIILRTTCSLGWRYAGASNVSCGCNEATDLTWGPSYYRSTSKAAGALYDSLLPLNTGSKLARCTNLWRASYYSWRIHSLLGGLLRGRDQHLHDFNGERKAYSQWLQYHENLVVHGKKLKVMLQPGYVSYVVWSKPACWLLLSLLDVGLFVGSSYARSDTISSACTLYAVLFLIILICTLAFEVFFTIVTLRLFDSWSRIFIKNRLDISPSLVVLDNGSIGKATGDPVVGDHVCFIAGCQSFAVLRPHSNGQSTTFTVVGKCSMQLKRADREEYEEMRKLLKSKQGFGEIMDQLERRHGWRKYDLV